MEVESSSCLGSSWCAFHRGHEFITVHLQLFAVAAGLLPVQLRRTQSDSNLLRGEKVGHTKRGGGRLEREGQCSLRPLGSMNTSDKDESMGCVIPTREAERTYSWQTVPWKISF